MKAENKHPKPKEQVDTDYIERDHFEPQPAETKTAEEFERIIEVLRYNMSTTAIQKLKEYICKCVENDRKVLIKEIEDAFEKLPVNSDYAEVQGEGMYKAIRIIKKQSNIILP